MDDPVRDTDAPRVKHRDQSSEPSDRLTPAWVRPSRCGQASNGWDLNGVERLGLIAAILARAAGQDPFLAYATVVLSHTGPIPLRPRRARLGPMAHDHPVLAARTALKAGAPVAVADAVLLHHERWNGSGYPYGYRRREIPPLARVAAIAIEFGELTLTGGDCGIPNLSRVFFNLRRSEAFDPALIRLLASSPAVDSLVCRRGCGAVGRGRLDCVLRQA